jgi:hypothetical protein
VGVGWGNYVIAWLLSYNGTDCDLWQYVLERCMEAELCRRLIELLPSIGYNLTMHKCYADEIAEADQAPKQPSGTSTKQTTTTNNQPN